MRLSAKCITIDCNPPVLSCGETVTKWERFLISTITAEGVPIERKRIISFKIQTTPPMTKERIKSNLFCLLY